MFSSCLLFPSLDFPFFPISFNCWLTAGLKASRWCRLLVANLVYIVRSIPTWMSAFVWCNALFSLKPSWYDEQLLIETWVFCVLCLGLHLRWIFGSSWSETLSCFCWSIVWVIAARWHGISGCPLGPSSWQGWVSNPIDTMGWGTTSFLPSDSTPSDPPFSLFSWVLRSLKGKCLGSSLGS